MFKTFVGAMEDSSSIAYLAGNGQGIFANYRNVLDTSRIKVLSGSRRSGRASGTKSIRATSLSAARV